MTVDEKVAYLIGITKTARFDPRIIEAAKNIVTNFGAVTEGDKVQAVFSYVRENIRFVRDPYQLEAIYYPTDTLVRGEADCEDFTTLLGAFLGALGYPVKFKVVDTVGYFNHIYPIVGIPAKTPIQWVALDATSAGLGIEPQNILKVKLYDVFG